jgi:nitrite reductase/ring-hydroxylating ferredoxin subunit
VSAPDLVAVAVYQRTIRASLERIWENVLDWEHLPGLHRGSFGAIRCLESDPSGWRARVLGRDADPSKEIEVQVRLDRPALRYVSETTAGAGKGAQIWTQLGTRAEHETDISVEFLLPGIPPAQVDGVGRAYLALYKRLWDEDEAMMVRREALLARAAALPERGAAELELGPLDDLRAKLPLVVELDGRPFRVLELGGSLVAHSTICPHLLGPLEDAELDGDTIECPWHRRRFDLRTGRSCDGHAHRLMPAPRIAIGPDRRVRLSWS